MRVQPAVFVVQAGVRGVAETIPEVDDETVAPIIAQPAAGHLRKVEPAAQVVALEVVVHHAEAAFDVRIEVQADVEVVGQHGQHQPGLERGFATLLPAAPVLFGDERGERLGRHRQRSFGKEPRGSGERRIAEPQVERDFLDFSGPRVATDRITGVHADRPSSGVGQFAGQRVRPAGGGRQHAEQTAHDGQPPHSASACYSCHARSPLSGDEWRWKTPAHCAGPVTRTPVSTKSRWSASHANALAVCTSWSETAMTT